MVVISLGHAAGFIVDGKAEFFGAAGFGFKHPEFIAGKQCIAIALGFTGFAFSFLAGFSMFSALLALVSGIDDFSAFPATGIAATLVGMRGFIIATCGKTEAASCDK